MPGARATAYFSPDFADEFWVTEHINGDVHPSLENDIHPIFSHVEDDTGEFPDSMITIIAARLASRLLGEALPFFHAILVQPPGDARGEPLQNSTESDVSRAAESVLSAPLETLTSAQKQATEAKLAELSHGVQFHLTSEDYTSAGCTVFRSDIRFPTLPGRGSEIRISSRFWRGAAAASLVKDMIGYGYEIFVVAQVLVHELSHAACMATQRWAPGQSMYGIGNAYIGADAILDEAGYALEDYLFGGTHVGVRKGCGLKHSYTLNDEPSSLESLIAFEDWPNDAKLQLYKKNNFPCNARGSLFPAAILWRLSCLHIARMLADDFWETTVRVQGRKALRFERKLGVVVKTRDDAPLVVDELQKSMVPKGFIGRAQRTPDSTPDRTRIQFIVTLAPDPIISLTEALESWHI